MHKFDGAKSNPASFYRASDHKIRFGFQAESSKILPKLENYYRIGNYCVLLALTCRMGKALVFLVIIIVQNMECLNWKRRLLLCALDVLKNANKTAV